MDGVRLLACLQFAGLGQAWLARRGGARSAPSWWSRPEKKAWPRSGPVCLPPARYARNRVPGFLCVPRPPPQRTGGRRSRARHMGSRPRAALGPPGGGEGRPGTCRSSRRLRSTAPAAQPPPRRALAPTPPEGPGTTAAAAAATPARSATDCPFPLPSLATPLHSGKRSPPRAFSSIGALGKNYHSRRPVRRGPGQWPAKRGR